MTVQPKTFDFSYTVHLAVSIPLEWTMLLKQIAAQHYDDKCRDAGKRGVINGLHNTACDGEFPSSLRVTWRDLDLITKVLEQAHYFPESTALAVAIGQWLRETKDKIEARLSALQEDPARTVVNSREHGEPFDPSWRNNHRWRSAPPTAAEVHEYSWWWNKPTGDAPRILQLDGTSPWDVSTGDGGLPEAWAPCLSPADVEGAIARQQRDDALDETRRLRAREEQTGALWRGRVRELDDRNAELHADRAMINVELRDAVAMNVRAQPVVEAALAWRRDWGLGSHADAALADAVDGFNDLVDTQYLEHFDGKS